MSEHVVHFSRVFAAAHRVWNDPGKCRNIHGHNYSVEVTITIDGDLNPQGFVVPFNAVKDVIDFFDHSLILDKHDVLAGSIRVLAIDDPDGVFAGLCVREIDGLPSTERMASVLANWIANSVQTSNSNAGDTIVTVGLRETDGITAVATATRPVTREAL